MSTEQNFSNQSNPQLPVSQDMSQISSTLNEKYLIELSKIAPRDIDSVKKWLSAYGLALQSLSNGFDVYNQWRPKQDALIKFPIESMPSQKTLNTVYKEMKKFARLNDLKPLLKATKKSHNKFKRVGLKIGVGISSFLIFGGIIYLLMNKK